MQKNNQNKGGFTLIEVLVVVLIIGILSSVALPQYQRSVYKARFAQAKVAASALAEAMEAYYPAHMEYTTVLDNLDVSIDFISTSSSCEETDNSSCTYYTSWGRCTLEKNGRVYCRLDKAALAYAIFLENNTYRAGNKLCFAWKITDPNAWQYKFCQQETGSPTREGSWDDNSGFLYRK